MLNVECWTIHIKDEHIGKWPWILHRKKNTMTSCFIITELSGVGHLHLLCFTCNCHVYCAGVNFGQREREREKEREIDR